MVRTPVDRHGPLVVKCLRFIGPGDATVLVRQSAIYAIGNIVQALLAMGLIALYTRVMSSDEFGAYAFVLTNVQFSYLLVVNWMSVSLVRLYHKASDREKLLGAYLGLFGILTLVGLVATLVMVPFLETAAQVELAFLGYLFFVAMAWMELNMHLYQARLEAGRQARARVTRSLVSAIVGGSLAWYGWGAHGAVIGAIVGMAGVGLGQGLKDWSGVPFGGDHEIRQYIRHYAVPLAISCAIGAAANFAGRYVIVIVGGSAMLGIYVLASELVTRASNLSLAPIGAASSSISYRDLNESGEATVRKRLRQTCMLLFGLALPGAAGLAVVAEDIAVTLFGSEFRAETAAILPFVGIALFTAAFRRNYLDLALHLGLRSNRFIHISSIILVTALAVNLWLVSAFGLLGAAYAAILTAWIEVGLTYLFGRSSFKLPFPLSDMFKIAIATSIMVLAVLSLPMEASPLALVVKILVGGLVYAISVFTLNVGSARTMVSRKLNRVADRSE